VLSQELPPPGGELTAQAEGYDCHPMAPRAMAHDLSMSHAFPIFASLHGASDAIILTSKMHVAHAGKKRTLCNRRQTG
jgi:hypothetical protein